MAKAGGNALGGTRGLIKAQALRLFAERGVDAVSVRDIAAACGMAAPNLYAHFGSKVDLVRELFREGYAEYGRMMAEAAAVSGPFRARLDRMVRLVLCLHDRDNLRFRFLVMTQHGYLGDVPPDASNPVEYICRAVAEAMEANEIPRRDPVLVAAAIVGLVVQTATFGLYGRIEGGLLQYVDQIVAMCERVAMA